MVNKKQYTEGDAVPSAVVGSKLGFLRQNLLIKELKRKLTLSEAVHKVVRTISRPPKVKNQTIQSKFHDRIAEPQGKRIKQWKRYNESSIKLDLPDFSTNVFTKKAKTTTKYNKEITIYLSKRNAEPKMVQFPSFSFLKPVELCVCVSEAIC